MGNKGDTMKRILVVDDVSINLRTVEKILKDQYRLSLAKSGEQALELLGRVKIDLVLLDLCMPDMDGYEVLEKIKGNHETKGIPVIFLTGDTDRDSEARCLELGAVDFIRKPIVPEVLIGRIKKAIEFEDTRQTLERSASCDPMTDLWNRRYITEFISEAKSDKTEGAFLMLDIDNFKSVNDSYGHDFGDKALICFADTLQEYAGKNICAGRLGGDEFVLFFRGRYSTDEISEECRKLIAVMEIRLNELTDAAVEQSAKKREPMSVSIGIAMMPEDGTTFSELYKNADKALYYIKQNGKKGFHFYQKLLNGPDDEEMKRSQIDIIQLKMMIEEKGQEFGAYKVEYDGFQKIYRFISRCLERKNQPVQIVLFTIQGENEDRDVMRKAMTELATAASGSLRRGDVIAKFSDCQYVVILIDASIENGRRAAERAMSRWNKIQKNSELSLNYEIQSIEKKA
jgi:diguanylate cyclase (GGDEF)-like protein